MILGHERQIAYLERAIARERMSHAYLFYGPERVGKRAVAYAIAQALLCPNARGSSSIAHAGDDCRVCRKIGAGAYQDVVILGLAATLISKKEVRKEIPIEDIRELKRRFSFAAAQDAWRIAIIDDADRMSAEASDSFLKLLEEPGGRTLFILIASSRDALPSTIVSRATPVGFSLVPDGILGPFLQTHLKKENTREMLAIAGGRAGIVIEFVEHPESLSQEKKFAVSFAALLRDGIPGALLLSEKAAEDEAVRERAIRAFIAGLRAELHTRAHGAERERIAHRIARVLDLTALMRATNVNTRLLLDVMFAEGAAKEP